MSENDTVREHTAQTELANHHLNEWSVVHNATRGNVSMEEAMVVIYNQAIGKLYEELPPDAVMELEISRDTAASLLNTSLPESAIRREQYGKTLRHFLTINSKKTRKDNPLTISIMGAPGSQFLGIMHLNTDSVPRIPKTLAGIKFPDVLGYSARMQPAYTLELPSRK